MRRYADRLLVPLALSVAVALTACVDIPGFFYDVRLPRTPTSEDCLTLAHAITVRFPDIEVKAATPHGGNCGVFLRSQHVWIYIGAVREQNRLGLQIRPPSANVAAAEIAQLAETQFPNAVVVRVHPKQGLGP